MKTILLCVLMLLSGLLLYGQQNYEVGVFIGASNYAGDLAKSLGPRFQENGPGLGLLMRMPVSHHLSVRGGLTYGRLQGNDYNYDERMPRGFKFQSSLMELAAIAEWEPFGRRRMYTDARGFRGMNNIISPYLYTGIGLGFVSYNVDFTRNTGTQLDPMIVIDKSVGSSTTVLALPVGLGVKFDLNPRFIFALELSARYPFSDYIDGVSLSGNASRRDWYYFGGITIGYRFLEGLYSANARNGRRRW